MTTEREHTEDGARRGGLPNGRCSRGWGKRCPASKGRTCRCACGGANHGKASGAGVVGGPAAGEAQFTVEYDGPEGMVLRDVGHDHGKSITNDADNVVARVADRLNGRRLFYFDSMGRLDELVVRDGKFARFMPGAPADVRTKVVTNDGLPRHMKVGDVDVFVGDLFEVQH